MKITESAGIGTRTNAITMKIESQHFTERLRAFYNKSFSELVKLLCGINLSHI